MPSQADLVRWLNLEKVTILAFDQSVHSCKILGQMLRGFGVRGMRAFTDVDDCKHALSGGVFDLVIADAVGTDGEGAALVRWLRREENNPNRFAPVILVSGHATASVVARSRDSGANYFIAKPLTANTLMDRILWVARDKRPFVEVGEYLGPDRRFKEDGAPVATGERRGSVEIDSVGKSA